MQSKLSNARRACRGSEVVKDHGGTGGSTARLTCSVSVVDNHTSASLPRIVIDPGFLTLSLCHFCTLQANLSRLPRCAERPCIRIAYCIHDVCTQRGRCTDYIVRNELLRYTGVGVEGERAEEGEQL